jgi:hypothetical protein
MRLQLNYQPFRTPKEKAALWYNEQHWQACAFE